MQQDSSIKANETEIALIQKDTTQIKPDDTEVSKLLPTASRSHSTGKLGIILAFTSILCNLGFSALRKLIPEISSVQYMFDRGFCSLILVTLYYLVTSQIKQIKQKFEWKLTILGSSSALSDCLYFIALVGLSMGEMTTILAMTAIFNGIIAYIFLGDPYLVIERVLGAISFIGVFLIVRPPFIFGPDEGADEAPGPDNTVIPRFFAACLALFVALAWSSIRVGIRSVSNRIPPIMVVFYINMMVVIIFGGYFLYSGEHNNNLTHKEIGMIVGSSVLHCLECTLMSWALAIERPSVIGIVGYSQLVISPIYDFVLWGTIPSLYTIIGASVIICCCIKLILVKK